MIFINVTRSWHANTSKFQQYDKGVDLSDSFRAPKYSLCFVIIIFENVLDRYEGFDLQMNVADEIYFNDGDFYLNCGYYTLKASNK